MKLRQTEITNEVKTLRYMRIQSGLSLRNAARLLDITDTAISHIENGKMKLPYSRIEQMVQAYGQSMNDFFKLSRAKVVPTDRREQCEDLLKRLPARHLEAVETVLRGFMEYKVNKLEKQNGR